MRLPPPDNLNARAARLVQLFAGESIDALVVTSLPNIAYLTGFFASAAALVATPDAFHLVSDGRYATTLEARGREWSLLRTTQLPPGQSYDEAIADILESLRGLRVGVEARHLTLSRHRFLAHTMAARGWTTELSPTDGLVERLRTCKDDWEVTLLRDGGARLSTVAKCILSKGLAGRLEYEVALEIEEQLRRVGFDRPSFDTIVAAGPNAALPHGRAGNRRIEPGEMVVMDFGGVLDGYCTDLTRTVTAGPSGHREHRLIAQLVEAQEAAFREVRAGSPPEAVDAAARDVLARHGIGEAFTHGTGHGLGLEIHEAPRVTRARPDQPEPLLAAGMALTLEPGAYFPGWGGARIEDDVLVTEGGADWLTDAPRLL
jgi:Xaa-Pro aminopeptidase